MAYPTKSLLLASASSQYASAANSASLGPTGAFTFEIWIKWTSLVSTGNRVFVFNKDEGQPNRSYSISFLNIAGQISMEILISTNGMNSGSNQVHVNIPTPSVGVWYHYAWVYTTGSGGTLEAFVDNVSQGTATGVGSSINSSSASPLLGAQNSGSSPTSFIDAKLSLARFWSTNRSAAQLASAQCTVLGSTTNLGAEWTFDNVYTDNSGNSNTLTPHNSPTFSADVPSVCAVFGPTRLKSINTIIKVNNKNINPPALANVKSINTVGS